MNIQQLLEITIERGASDLHLVVGYPPMIRVHGDLVPVMGAPVLTDNENQALIYALLSPEQRAIFEKNLELDFALSFPNRARFRGNIFREQNHIAAAFRYIPLNIPELDGLGLPKAVLKLVDLKQGLILVTGPTGHGKSTTLAAMINRINRTKNTRIMTVEDPIEYVYPKAKGMVTQREMWSDSRSWSNSLKAVFREDPDVILVGEMRDLDTMAATISIAETGHLVFATLHTNSAAQSIDRIIDAFPPYQQPQIKIQLAATLEAVISQRLVPTILPGRILAVEMLLKTPALSSLIREGKTHLIDNLIQTSAELGMVTLEASLVRLIREDKINFEIAQYYTIRPDLLAKLLGE